MGENRLSANLLLGGSVVCLCSKAESRITPADLRDERTNEHDRGLWAIRLKRSQPPTHHSHDRLEHDHDNTALQAVIRKEVSPMVLRPSVSQSLNKRPNLRVQAFIMNLWSPQLLSVRDGRPNCAPFSRSRTKMSEHLHNRKWGNWIAFQKLSIFSKLDERLPRNSGINTGKLTRLASNRR